MTYHNTLHMIHQPQYWVEITGEGIAGITRQCLDSRWFLTEKEILRHSQEFQEIIDGLWRDSIVPTRLNWGQQYLSLARAYNLSQWAAVLPPKISWRNSLFNIYALFPATRQSLERFLGVRFREDTSMPYTTAQTVNSETRLRAANAIIRKASSLITERSKEIYYQFEDYWYTHGSALIQEHFPLDDEIAIDEERWTVAINNAYRRRHGSIVASWGHLWEEILELFLSFVYTQERV